jgi:3-deoxy-7-phosphoheptulonate synthase
MLIVLRNDATAEDVERACAQIRELGFKPHPIPGDMRTAIGVTGNQGPIDPALFSGLPCVLELIPVTKPYKLTSREVKPQDTIVRVGEVRIGGPEVVVIAGPCSVESSAQLFSAARAVKSAGARLLRGGAFKPRTSPYAFQGLGAGALEILARAREETGLPIVSEAVDTDGFEQVEELVDVVQIGSRNMQNYSLLRRAGRSRRPVLLKRSMSGTLEEFLMAAEYLLSEGNHDVILCERGIRAFSDYSRYTLDLSIVPELKRITHLPVVVDPSHAAGRRDLVAPLARAAIAAGADGVIVEVHPEPDRALSDGPQSLTPAMFARMMDELRALADALARRVAAVA